MEILLEPTSNKLLVGLDDGVAASFQRSRIHKPHAHTQAFKTGSEVQEEPHHDIRPTLQRLPFYYTPPTADDTVIPDPTPAYLAAGTPSAKILLVTPFRSAAVISSLGNQGGSSAIPAAEDSPGKGIMADDVTALFVGTTPSFRMSLEMLFMRTSSPFLLVLIMPPTLKVVLLGIASLLARTDFMLKGYEEKVASLTGLELQVSALKKQVSGLNDKLSSSNASFAKSKAKGTKRKKKIKSLTKSLDNLHTKVARLSVDLNRATILEAERDEEILRLKATPPEFSSFFRGQFQGLVRKFLASDEFSRVQGKLLSLAASVGLAEASHLVAQIDYAFLNKIFEHATEPRSVILQLEAKKLARSANVPTSRDACVSPPIAKDSIVKPASKSLELFVNVVPAPFAVALEQNEEWVNAMVDGPDIEMTGGVAPSKSRSVFVQGISHVLDDVAEVTVVGSERVSSGPTDVVVALSVCEKGDGSLPSSAADEEAAANPSRV
ncbi:hypothetical protein Tco_0616621 [Tanacetum coccineum]